MSSSLDKLRAAMETASPSDGAKKSYGDDTMWKPELDKSGNGYAVVRFLPTPDGEEMPWVSYFDHGFQGPGGWFIEKSLTTLNKEDPVSEYNTQLWNTGIKQIKILLENRNADCIMFQMSMLFQTLKILLTKVKYSSIGSERKSLKHLRKQSHQHLKMRKQLILLTSEEKVPTLRLKSERLTDTGTMINQSSIHQHLCLKMKQD